MQIYSNLIRMRKALKIYKHSSLTAQSLLSQHLTLGEKDDSKTSKLFVKIYKEIFQQTWNNSRANIFIQAGGDKIISAKNRPKVINNIKSKKKNKERKYNLIFK